MPAGEAKVLQGKLLLKGVRKSSLFIMSSSSELNIVYFVKK